MHVKFKDTKEDAKPSLYNIYFLRSPGWKLMFKISVFHILDTGSPTSYKKGQGDP